MPIEEPEHPVDLQGIVQGKSTLSPLVPQECQPKWREVPKQYMVGEVPKLPRQSLHVHSSTVTRLASAIQPPRSPEIGDNLKEVDPSVFSMLPIVFTTDVVQGRWDRPVNQGKRVYVI